MQPPRLTATDFSNSSPIMWPSESLTLLNSSISMYSTANCSPRSDARQFLLQPLAKQGAVRQIGQRVVMRQMRDPFLGASAFGDVLVGRDPSAVRQWLVDDLDRAAVGGFDDPVTFSAPTLRRTSAQNSSRSPLNEPVALRWAMSSRKCSPASPPPPTSRTSRYSAGCRRPAAAMHRTAAGPASCC